MTDVDLATRRWGAADRPALFVHGITSDSGGWWRAGPAVAGLGYGVVAVDLRGHGDSTRAPGYGLSDYVGDLLALGSSWELVIGHSLGGAIVLSAAAEDPAFASRLVLMDPWLVNDGSPPPNQPEYQAIESAEEIAARNPRWAEGDVAAKATALSKVDRPMIAATFAQRWNLMPLLTAMTVPCLLLAADPELGALTTQAMGEEAARGNRHVRFETIRGAGHSMHRDSWEGFWAVLREFADS